MNKNGRNLVTCSKIEEEPSLNSPLYQVDPSLVNKTIESAWCTPGLESTVQHSIEGIYPLKLHSSQHDKVAVGY